MPKVFSLPIFTKSSRRSVPSVILWFLDQRRPAGLGLIFLFCRSSKPISPTGCRRLLSALPEELLAEFQLDNLPELSEF